MSEVKISTADIQKLREMTGAGMMDCKKALTEAGGDYQGAIDELRKKGIAKAAKREDREAKEGVVIAQVNGDQTKGIIIALQCETDFVAKNQEFVGLGEGLVALAANNGIDSADALLSATYKGQTVEASVTDLVGKIGEKIDIVAVEKVSGDQVVSYIHSNKKIGVLLALNGVNGTDVTELGKDITMQIASMKPIAVDKDGVDAKTVEREIEIGKDQARQEGKPEAMLEKIAIGKLNKFYQDSTLLNQFFVKDSSKTIRQLIEGVSKDISVVSFKRVALGA
jgi:elongation factor Ts